jgi:hypothetical protein
MLTAADVQNIRERLAKGERQRDIAATFGVSRSLISDIATRRAYAKVGPAETGGPEAEILLLREELAHARKYAKHTLRLQGLLGSLVREMDSRISPLKAPTPPKPKKKRGVIEEHAVLLLSDMHADQVVRPEEVGGLERYDFNVACARAEKLVDSILDWALNTLGSTFHFPVLHILSLGDTGSFEIHDHDRHSYFQSSFKAALAIGQLQALMVRDLAAHFEHVSFVGLSGNHGRRHAVKEFVSGPVNSWDYLVHETCRLYCRDMKHVNFVIPNAFSVNLAINGIGVHCFHGDDVKSSSGIPFYNLLRRQKALAALGNAGPPIRLTVCGHFHLPASLADVKTELIVNGAFLGCDQYAYNSFAGYREPSQLIFGVHKEHGVTWRLPIKLRTAGQERPRRYIINHAT